jgi:hypothetical protein
MMIHITIGHDLVAISMGTGGWVFKNKIQNAQASMLEPKMS